MKSPLHLRLLTSTDLPFADSLRALAGWNQTFEDWERFLRMDPDGCFLAAWDGTPAGTATTTLYGPELAWIGMVLVHPDFRQRGIARALLARCIEFLQSRSVRCIKLDATPAGKKVYAALGFKEEWTLTRWENPGLHPRDVAVNHRILNWADSENESIQQLDSEAFGVCRKRLIEALIQQSHVLVMKSESGSLAGYGMLRNGSKALYLGPVVADRAETGLALIETLLVRSEGRQIFWDIPDQNLAATHFAEKNGFIQQRSLTRMVLGENSTPGAPQKQFALAGPEVG